MSNEHGYHGNTENHLARLRRIDEAAAAIARLIKS